MEKKSILTFYGYDIEISNIAIDKTGFKNESGKALCITAHYDKNKYKEISQNFIRTQNKLKKFYHINKTKLSGHLNKTRIYYKSNSGYGYYCIFSSGSIFAIGTPQSLFDGSEYAEFSSYLKLKCFHYIDKDNLIRKILIDKIKQSIKTYLISNTFSTSKSIYIQGNNNIRYGINKKNEEMPTIISNQNLKSFLENYYPQNQNEKIYDPGFKQAVIQAADPYIKRFFDLEFLIAKIKNNSI